MLDNASIAELLSREAETAQEPLNRALRRAGRAAFLWPEEAEEMLKQGRSLMELPGVGPYLEKRIVRWIEQPPKLEEPPWIRRGFLTLAYARRVLAGHPRWRLALQGDLQMHTDWSDGSGSIWEMAQAAERRGYRYVAITDHSKGLKIAGGIDENELKEQHAEIAEVNQQLAQAASKLRVLHSVEMNLNPQGQGDLQPEALEHLDLVLGSFHSALRKTEDQTDRYLAALNHAGLHILGHPCGRIYDHRSGLTAQWQRVFERATELGKAVEIDAYPDRQDLSVALARVAAEAGCHISLGTDAHHASQLEFMELGLAAALLANVKQERILNFMAQDQLMTWVSQTRHPKSISPAAPRRRLRKVAS